MTASLFHLIPFNTAKKFFFVWGLFINTFYKDLLLFSKKSNLEKFSYLKKLNKKDKHVLCVSMVKLAFLNKQNKQ